LNKKGANEVVQHDPKSLASSQTSEASRRPIASGRLAHAQGPEGDPRRLVTRVRLRRDETRRARAAIARERLNVDPVETPTNLADEVRRRLADDPVATWGDAVGTIAEEDD
jgi:hypothetical protein